MSLLLPIFFGAAALIGLPIVLHFLRRKPRVTVVFPTLQFLGPSAVRETKRHRLRRWLTLLTRCLIILLICLAFSRPFWPAHRFDHGRAVVVAIDDSFSMRTKGRWEKLRDWATAQLAGLGPEDRAGLLLVDPSPRWLVPLTDKLDQVREALAAQEPGYETTRYDPSLRLAGDALVHSGAPDLTLVWMADEQQLGWQGVNFTTPLPAGVKLDLPPPIDLPARQASIARARWENNGQGLALRLDIHAFTPGADTRTLTISAGGKILAQQQVQLAANQPFSVVVPLPGLRPDQIAGVTAQLDPDDLSADDTFYAVHDKEDSARIFLTAPENGADFDFLRHAINATKQVEAAPFQASDLPDAAWPAGSVVIVRGSAPFEPPLVSRLDAFLQAGGAACLFLDGSPAQVAWMKQHHIDLKPVAGSADAPLHLRNWDTTHPLLTPVAGANLIGLLDIEFYRGLALEGVDATPLATWDDGRAAIAEVTVDGLHFLACGFVPEREATNWPVRTSFVPFVHSALLWLSRQQKTGGDWRVGDTMALPGPGTWKGIAGPANPGEVGVSGSVRPTVPGIYQFTANGQSRLYAVNLKAEESDPGLWAATDDFLALTNPQKARSAAQPAALTLSQEEAENQQRAWWWLLALAVVLILAELRLANRTSM